MSGSTRERRRLQKRSITIATATIEQITIGSINKPPALIISHTVVCTFFTLRIATAGTPRRTSDRRFTVGERVIVAGVYALRQPYLRD